MRFLILHNPRSGFGSDAIYEFERALLHDGDECLMRIMDDAWDPKQAVQDAALYDRVIISGGDGTIGHLMYALRNTGVPLCVFPSGTANLICASIGNAHEPAALALAVRRGHTTQLDLGEISWTSEAGHTHTHGIALVAGSGLDAQLMRTAIPHKKFFGEAAYFTAALSNLAPTVQTFTITVDGVTHERQGIACLVANSAKFQADFELLPGVRMDDGLLSVIVLETKMTAELVKPLFTGLFDRSGKTLGRPNIEGFHGREVHVEMSSPIPVEVDGEVFAGETRTFDARVLPKACTVIVDTLSPYAQK